MKSPATHFCLDDGEPFAGGLHRIFREQLDKALWQIGERPDHRNTVQNVRRCVKRLRAILRLLHDAIGDDIRTAENRRLRDAGRCISALRDAQMRLRTVEEFARDCSSRRAAFAETRQTLNVRLAKVSETAPDALRKAAGSLEAARARMDEWFPAGVKRRQLRDGLRRIYKDGRALFGRAASKPSDDAMHAWRKRVKDLWYQLQLVENVGSQTVGNLIRESGELSELIGRVHDLDVLHEAVIELRICDEREGLLALLKSHRSQLRRSAINLGRKLYAENAKDFAARIFG